MIILSRLPTGIPELIRQLKIEPRWNEKKDGKLEPPASGLRNIYKMCAGGRLNNNEDAEMFTDAAQIVFTRSKTGHTRTFVQHLLILNALDT